MSISVQLKVDNQALDFGIIAQDAAGIHSSLLTSWTNVHYYTELVTSPLSSSVVLIAITILVIFHRLRKRRNQKLIVSQNTNNSEKNSETQFKILLKLHPKIS